VLNDDVIPAPARTHASIGAMRPVVIPSLPPLVGMALAIVAAWAAAGVFFATQNHAMALADSGDLATGLFVMLVSTFVSALLTPFLLYAVERAPVRRGDIVRPVLKLLVPVLLFAIAHALFDAWSPTILDGASLSWDEFFAIAAATVHPHFLMGAGVVTLATLLHARRENVNRRVREIRIENDLSRAQLQLLQAEMEPHFLFNTLNAAAALLTRDREQAASTVFTLASLLQSSHELGQQTSIAVSSEVAFLESYLTLQKVRFPDRLTTRIVVDPETWDLPVPSLILQPLVENAILHGVIDRPRGGTVTVSVHRHGDVLRLEVRDDGPGADAHELTTARGLGLANTRSRLQCLFKNDHQLQFLRTAGEFVVAMTIPITAGHGSRRT
jgi:two-component system, LytTR family, sensor kinase